MKSLLAALAVFPAPALASFDCVIDRSCAEGICKDVAGVAFLIEETSDSIRVLTSDRAWEGYRATTSDVEEYVVLLPPQDGMVGLISVSPSGDLLFTVHGSGTEAQVSTSLGNREVADD